jgi:hypothetical protein
MNWGLLYRKPKNMSLFTNFLKGENVVTPSVWSTRPAELAAKEIRKGSVEEIR